MAATTHFTASKAFPNSIGASLYRKSLIMHHEEYPANDAGNSTHCVVTINKNGMLFSYPAIGSRDALMDAAYDDGALGVTVLVQQ